MKKFLAIALALCLCVCVPARAEGSSVIYDGEAQQFVFAPGSDLSPTDLFPDFKGILPGDSLTQSITVRNDASNRVKVKIYLRALGAQEGSEEFLSYIGLRVEKSEENEMPYMFDAAASETAQLTDWVCLGTLFSGGTVDLNVILDVSTELGNEFFDAVGYLDWEFRVEEFPIEDGDPIAPTGDDFNLPLWLTLAACVPCMMLLLVLWRKKENSNENH